MEKQSKLVRLVEWIYQLCTQSLAYWGIFLSSLGIYSFVEAAERLMKQTGGQSANRFRHGRVLSFIWSILLSMVFTGYFHVRTGSLNDNELFVWIIGVTAFAFYHVFLITMVLLNREEDDFLSGRLLYARSLDRMLRKPMKSLFILVLSGAAVLVAFLNLVFFIFLVPALYWRLLMVVDKSIEEVHRVKFYPH